MKELYQKITAAPYIYIYTLQQGFAKLLLKSKFFPFNFFHLNGNRYKLAFMLLMVASFCKDLKGQTEIFWVGDGVNNFWGTAGNWNPAVVPADGDIAVFKSSSQPCNINTGATVRGIRVEASYAKTIFQGPFKFYTKRDGNNLGGNAEFFGGEFRGNSENDIEIEGDLTIDGAIFRAPQDLFLEGSISLLNDGVFDHNSGHIEIKSVGIEGKNYVITNSTTGPLRFNNLELKATTSLKLGINANPPTHVIVLGTLTTSGGGQLGFSSQGNGTIALQGDLVINNTNKEGGNAEGGVSPVNSYFVFNGAGNQTIFSNVSPGRGMLPHVRINKPIESILFFNNITTIRGDFKLVKGVINAVEEGAGIAFFGPSTYQGTQSISSDVAFRVNELYLGASSGANIGNIDIKTTITVNSTLHLVGTHALALTRGNIDVLRDIEIRDLRERNPFLVINDPTNINIIGDQPHIITGIAAENKSWLPNLVINTTGSVTVNGIVSIDGNVNFIEGTLDCSGSGSLFVFSEFGTTTGANSKSYIKGPVKKFGQTLFKFPIGDLGSYHPIQVGHGGFGTRAYTAQFFNGNPLSIYAGTLQPPASRLSDCRYWTLVKNFGDDVKVSLDHLNECMTDANMQDLRVCGWNSQQGLNTWEFLGTDGSAATTGMVRTPAIPTNFEAFALADYSVMFKYCGETALNLDVNNLLAADDNQQHDLYRFEFSLTDFGTVVCTRDLAKGALVPLSPFGCLKYNQKYFVRVLVSDDGRPFSIGRVCSFTTAPCPAGTVNVSLTPENAGCKRYNIFSSVSGGTIPYTYSWGGGQTTTLLTNQLQGNYSLNITDAQNCSASANVNIVNPPNLALTTSKTDEACNSLNGTATAIPAGGTQPYTYSWHNGQTGATATGLSAGTYSVTVYDQNNCSPTSGVVINAAPPLGVNVTIVQATCNTSNGAAKVEGTGSVSPYTYSWSHGPVTAEVINLAPGTYSVTVTDQAGCTISTEVLIKKIEDPQPVITFNFSNSGCTSKLLSIDPVTNYTYQWLFMGNPVAGATSTSFLAEKTGSYAVQIISPVNCIITSPPVDIRILVPNQELTVLDGCSSSVFTAPAPPDDPDNPIVYTYQWYENNVAIAGATNQSYTSSSSGSLVKAQISVAGFGCTPFTNEIPVPPFTTAIFTFPEFDNAEGNPGVIFTNNSTYVGASTCIWEFNDGSDPIDNCAATIQHPFPFPGYFHVKLRVTDANGCFDDFEDDIYILPAVGGYNQGNCVINKIYTDYGHVTITAAAAPKSNPLHLSQHRTIKGTLIIKSGAHLIVDPGWFIRFGPQGKVVVEHDAELTINGATFTSNTAMICGGRMMWQGIEVWGSDGANGVPGKLNVMAAYDVNGNLIKKALIEDAYNGITVGKWELKWDPILKEYTHNLHNPDYSNGVINVTGSRFNRNFRSIVFWERKAKNLSVISGNQFLSRTIGDPDQGLYTGVFDPYFLYTTPERYTFPSPAYYHNPFIAFNDETGSSMTGRAHTGIFALQAGPLNISDNTFDNSFNGIDLADTRSNISGSGAGNNRFRNIPNKAILVANTKTSALFKQNIVGNTFEGGLGTGIFLSSSTSMDLVDNNKFDNQFGQSANQTGISTDYSSNFLILDNEFNLWTEGIKVEGAGEDSYSRIGPRNKGNIFSNTGTAIVVAAPEGATSMLEIRCNTFDNKNSANYSGLNMDIVGNIIDQGTGTSEGGDPKAPAGNLFDRDSPAQTAEREIKVTKNPKILKYYHHWDWFTIPDPVEFSYSQPLLDKVYYVSFTNSCAGSAFMVRADRDASPLEEYDARIDSLLLEYSAVQAGLDKGETTQLLTALESNMPVGKLKTLLVDHSPLSDEVLDGFIDQWETIPPGIFKEIMAPNLPVSDQVWIPLLNTIEGFPEGIKAAIMALQGYNPDYRTLTAIESEIIQTRTKRQKTRNEILTGFIENDQENELLALLSQEEDTEGKMLYASTLISVGDYDQALAVIISLPGNLQSEIYFKELYITYIGILTSGRTIFEMNSLEVETIRSIAASCTPSQPVNSARRIIEIVKGELPEPCLPANLASQNTTGNNNEEFSKEQKSTLNTSMDNNKKNHLGMNVPNPFNGGTGIPYSIQSGTIGTIMIYDLFGKLINEYNLPQPNGVLEISLENLPSGIYLYNLMIDGVKVQTRRMINNNK